LSGRRATSVAVGYAVLGVLPLFLVSAQSVQLQRELGFNRAGLGLAVSVCFIASALAAAPVGRGVSRLGPSAGLRASAALTFVGLLVLVIASAWWHVALALALTGVANVAAQVSTNVVLAAGVRARRQGIAFGTKQAAVPIASLAAGLALPLVGLLAGWRWSFAGAAAIVAVACVLVPPIERVEPESGPALRVRTPLLFLLAACGLLAGAAGNSIPTFAVDASVSRGIGEHTAGLLLAAGSLAAISARIGFGWIADRRGSAGVPELALLTGTGALACALLALAGASNVLFAVALIAAVGAAWGWPGLMYFAVVRTHPQAPAAATAFVLAAVSRA
jgi:MFS family permease